MSASSAREIASLSLRSSTDEARNDRPVCIGAGRQLGLSTDDCPPGKMKVISSYQRIWFFDAEAPIEVDEVGAAAEQTRAGSYRRLRRCRELVRRRAAAEIRAALEQLDAIAGVGERATGGEPGKAAADYRHRRLGCWGRGDSCEAAEKSFRQDADLLRRAEPTRFSVNTS